MFSNSLKYRIIQHGQNTLNGWCKRWVLFVVGGKSFRSVGANFDRRPRQGGQQNFGDTPVGPITHPCFFLLKPVGHADWCSTLVRREDGKFGEFAGGRREP